MSSDPIRDAMKAGGLHPRKPRYVVKCVEVWEYVYEADSEDEARNLYIYGRDGEPADIESSNDLDHRMILEVRPGGKSGTPGS